MLRRNGRIYRTSSSASSNTNSRRIPKFPWRVFRARILQSNAIPFLCILVLLIIIIWIVLYRRNTLSTLNLRDIVNEECSKDATVRHIVPGIVSPTLIQVRFGSNCTLYFLKDHFCPPHIHEFAAILRLPVLPCVNWSLPLSAATPRATLRAFGIRSRSDATLPFRVPGALVHASTAPLQAIDAPDSRPYTWRANAPTALECADASDAVAQTCRVFIAALTLAYLSGCHPLHSDALWRPAMNNALIDSNSALLAFPRGCTRASGASEGIDRVAGDVLSRYLSSTCELPSSVFEGITKLNSSRNFRLKRILMMIKPSRSFWSGWIQNAGFDSICDGGIRRYGNNDRIVALRSATLTWQQELDAAAGFNT